MNPETTLTCERRWQYDASRRLTQWYGHVHLAGPDAIGQWVRLDLETGACHWHHDLGRPNTLIGMTDTMLIASETRSDGPWTRDFGVYGIDRAHGRLRWTAHAEGRAGRLWRLLDALPGFTNELRDTPKRVIGQTVVCRSGRVLSTETGALLKRVKSLPKAPVSDAWTLYCDHRLERANGTLRVDADRSNFRVWLDAGGQTQWRFSVARRGRYIDGNYFSWRLVADHLVFLVSTRPQRIPTGRHTIRFAPVNFELWFVNLSNGAVEARVPVARGVTECRIEDADARHVLVSHDRLHLTCFRWGGSRSG